MKWEETQIGLRLLAFRRYQLFLEVITWTDKK